MLPANIFQGTLNSVSLTTDGDSPASYAGYMDASISTDPLPSYYGHNADRLKLIKAKYDRADIFDNPLGISPGR